MEELGRQTQVASTYVVAFLLSRVAAMQLGINGQLDLPADLILLSVSGVLPLAVSTFPIPRPSQKAIFGVVSFAANFGYQCYQTVK